MNKVQIEHRRRILATISKHAHKKYERGANQHKGDLLDKPLLDLLLDIRDEAIDTLIYAETAIEKLQKT